MVTRRSVVKGLGALGGLQLLGACGGPSTPGLTVGSLQRSLPAQLIANYKKQLPPGRTFTIKPVAQLAEFQTLLAAWQGEGDRPESSGLPWGQKKIPPRADLVSLNPYQLSAAIQNQWLEPLPLENSPPWQQLPSRWGPVVRRNDQGLPDGQGRIWGAPYRWGTTMVVYRRDLVAPELLGDWSDLWRPEFQQRLAVVAQPREILGFTLKKLGMSYNTPDLDSVFGLGTALKALRPQIRIYGDRNYLQPLILGDVWAAVGWSADILPVVERNPNLGVMVPRSGTAIWADLWVSPRGHDWPKNPDQWQACADWIEFCWQGRSQQLISLFTAGLAPQLLDRRSLERDFTPSVQEKINRLYPPETLARSEFILPLTPESQAQYDRHWQRYFL